MKDTQQRGRPIRRLLFSIFLLLVVSGLHSQNVDYQLAKDISYYEDADPTAYQEKMSTLDISYPDVKDAPVIIWFHGGGLTAGEKELPEALTQKGYCVVAVGYRLAPEVNAEVSVLDAAAAVAWVMKNIQRYNGDPEKIFVSGHSAGGYLSLMSVMNKSLLAKHGLDANEIAGLIPFSGHTITHFTIREQKGIPGEQPVIDEWAPLYFVRAEAPPILLITGDREMEMLGRYEENAYFYRMMKVAGHNDIDIYEMDGYGHNMAHPAFPLLLDFVEDRSKEK